ncbi:MAG: polysaccharide deacetylase family protein [Candidatus Eremiobacteraeota bacterium]|nr:polysaccharide deacetylase family protein [Candidatus Eremiobacteraeota bacterium]
MKRGGVLASAALLAVVLIVIYYIAGRSSVLFAPTVIAQKMDVHQAIARDLPSRARRLMQQPILARHADGPRLIALTFDDGPYAVTTPLLLDALRDLRVHATFFYIGRDAQQYPELTSRTSREGHEIANHTFSHPNLDQLSNAAVAEELASGARALHRYSADPAIDHLFRPPHGRYTEATLQVAQKLGYQTILWSDDGGDWRTLTVQSLAEHLETHATAPEIVLLHSGRLPTIQMLPEVVARFRAAGYEFVTVSQMLARVTLDQTNHPSKHAL